MANNILTDRLKDEMEKKNWTGRKLSKRANLSYNAIHYILSGKNKSTNFEVVSAIADVLGVSPFYLLDENYNERNVSSNTQNNLNFQISAKEKIPYDGKLYREIMCIVEELLTAKNNLTMERVEYFTRYIYPQIKKAETKGEKKNTRSYIEGIIDYALNTAS